MTNTLIVGLIFMEFQFLILDQWLKTLKNHILALNIQKEAHLGM